MKGFAVILSVIVVVLSACAFAPHKQIAIKPDISVTNSTIGQGQNIGIVVVDERTKSTLGTRGVRGVGSEIAVEGDLRIPIRNSIADGLKRQGFTPVNENPPDDRQLRVEIRNLDYNVIMGFWSGTLKTGCGLKGVCILGNSRPYEKLYLGEFQESIQVVQSEAANERYINAAVSSAVNNLLQDIQLMRCLATQKQP